jgi:hypothetical protein
MADTLHSKRSAAMHEGSSPSFGTIILYLSKTMTNILNEQAFVAIDNPNLFSRIEECIVNAKTELAKRRLVRATVILSELKAVDDNMNAMAGWE